jgi:uncharacterized protein YaiI (UPF0178 family)
LLFALNVPIKSLLGRKGFELRISEAGADAVDGKILEGSQAGDVVVTADLLLAEQLQAKGVRVVNFQGVLVDGEVLKQGLGERRLALSLKQSGYDSLADARLGQATAQSGAAGKQVGKSGSKGRGKNQKKGGKSKHSLFKERFHNHCIKSFTPRSSLEK